LHDEPPRHFREPARQQTDVETQTPRDIVPGLLLGAQQIEKQRAIARFADDSRDELIARTVPAAGAAVCKRSRRRLLSLASYAPSSRRTTR
jgi:hypothetical protein